MKINNITHSCNIVSGANNLPDLSKRQLLKAILTAGVVSSSSLIAGCTSLKGMLGFSEKVPERVIVREKIRLDSTQRAVFEKLASVLLPANEAEFPSLDDVGYLSNVESILANLSEADRDNVFLGLSWFNLSPVFSWRLSSFSNMKDKTAEKHIANWQDGFKYQQGVINTLHSLALNAYWRDDRTGKAVGYYPAPQQELPSLPIF